LAVDPAVEIVAAVGDVESLCEACDRHRPDVVVPTDIRMPPTSTDQGIRLAGELERVHNRAELMAAIRAVADGGSMIDRRS
jgi:DNA-binding NarL/FixJ family response regulator